MWHLIGFGLVALVLFIFWRLSKYSVRRDRELWDQCQWENNQGDSYMTDWDGYP